MRQAIIAKYLGPTNHHGTSVKVSCQARSLIFDWDHSLGLDDNFRSAALKYAEKLGWSFTNAGEGTLPSGECVFTMQKFGGAQ